MKIIASDYDGTLRRHSGIEQKDRDAVKEWRANGNLFGIVTGRGQDFTKTVFEDDLELDFVIVYNGAVIYDFSADVNKDEANLLKLMVGKTDRLYEMLPLILRKSGDWAEFITPDKVYYLTYNDESPNSRNNWAKNEVLKGVSEFIQIYSLYKSEREPLDIAKQLNDGFGDAASALVNGSWLNVAPAGVTKASGVLEYAKIMSVGEGDIYTIGDSYNDLEMIKAFNGYTVENGADEIKKAAKGVFGGVWELISSLNK